MSLPDVLVEKLRKDQHEAYRQLQTASLMDCVQPVKENAERRLLAMTDKAIGVIDEVMDFDAPKERLAAAAEVLDRSPATKPQISQATDNSLPAEALKTLMEGMGKMFGMALAHIPSEMKVAEGAHYPMPPATTRNRLRNRLRLR